ncbi:MAG: electron transport complex subunit E [Candidatus Aminicenantes bacterium]|nr:electron transport complex subunit E [Candidatus Aminicenantes bacterium]
MAQKTIKSEFFKGIWSDNPVTRQLLGLCSVLAVSNAVINGVAMGLAVTFVLVFSSLIVSVIRKIVPNQVRIASFIVIIATFVTIADRVLAAYFPQLSKAMGPYVPLIVVNCIILGRAEAFASKNKVGRSIIDALGMSCGYILTLLLMGFIRELLGNRSILGYQILGKWFEPWVVMLLPPGAFIMLGLIIALFNLIENKIKEKQKLR